jgi:PEP-CTERM motif
VGVSFFDSKAVNFSLTTVDCDSPQVRDSAWLSSKGAEVKRIVIAAVALAIASPAVAAPPPYTIIWNPQSTTLPAYTAATVIQDFETPDVANNTPYGGRTVAGVFTDTALVPGPHSPRTSVFETLLSGMDGQYIGVVNGSDYILQLLSGGVQFLSFALNGVHQNDKLKLSFSDGTSQEIVGFDILNGPKIIGGQNPGDIPDPPDDWGRVSYDMNGGLSIVEARFSSGSGTWYIDSIAFAAPEPGTWAMLIMGFGLAGWQLRLRRRKLRLATA